MLRFVLLAVMFQIGIEVQACPVGQHTSKSDDEIWQCKDCNGGQYGHKTVFTGDAFDECMKCGITETPGGTYPMGWTSLLTGANQACYPRCPKGKYGNYNSLYGRHGVYHTSEDDACKTCPKGTYVSSVSCKSEDNKLTRSDTRGGSSDNLHYECRGRLPKIKDITGKTLNEVYSSEHACSMCSPGQYADTTGTVNCKKCAEGKAFVTSSTGETDDTKCTSCPSGQYSSTGMCTLCPYGKYASTSETKDCKSCPTGKTTFPKTGVFDENECITCPSGQYKNATNNVCEGCPVGWSSTINGDLSATSCLNCAAGFYSGVAPRASCKGCPPGYFTSESGQENCKSCYSINSTRYTDEFNQTKCKTCPDGRVWNYNEGICGCDLGFHLEGDTCVQNDCNCSNGYISYTDCSKNKGPCSDCNEGYIWREQSRTCEKVEYNSCICTNGWAVGSTCSDVSGSNCCPGGDADTCSTCKEGYYLSKEYPFVTSRDQETDNVIHAQIAKCLKCHGNTIQRNHGSDSEQCVCPFGSINEKLKFEEVNQNKLEDIVTKACAKGDVCEKGGWCNSVTADIKTKNTEGVKVMHEAGVSPYVPSFGNMLWFYTYLSDGTQVIATDLNPVDPKILKMFKVSTDITSITPADYNNSPINVESYDCSSAGDFCITNIEFDREWKEGHTEGHHCYSVSSEIKKNVNGVIETHAVDASPYVPLFGNMLWFYTYLEDRIWVMATDFSGNALKNFHISIDEVSNVRSISEDLYNRGVGAETDCSNEGEFCVFKNSMDFAHCKEERCELGYEVTVNPEPAKASILKPLFNLTCMDKTCTCASGTPATGDRCKGHNSEICEPNCPEGKHTGEFSWHAENCFFNEICMEIEGKFYYNNDGDPIIGAKQNPFRLGERLLFYHQTLDGLYVAGTNLDGGINSAWGRFFDKTRFPKQYFWGTWYGTYNYGIGDLTEDIWDGPHTRLSSYSDDVTPCDPNYYGWCASDVQHTGGVYECISNCVCTNGIPAQDQCSDPSTILCEFCDEGYELVPDSSQCEDECPPGQSYQEGSLECQDIICACDDGVPATGEECSEGANICTSCNDYFTLEGNSCRPNECECLGGVPGIGCDNGVTLCAWCHTGYTLEDNVCKLDYRSKDVSDEDLAGVDLRGALMWGVKGRLSACPEYLSSSWKCTNNYLVGPNADLTDADLKVANLLGADLTGVKGRLSVCPYSFVLPSPWKCRGNYLVGPGADLTSANLKNANLADVDFTAANLLGADLTGVKGKLSVCPEYLSSPWKCRGNYLVGPGADLTSANLKNADLTDVDFTAANLLGADLTGVKGKLSACPEYLSSPWKCRGNYLIGPGADLRGADLTGADLTGVELTSEMLTGIAGAKFVGDTDCDQLKLAYKNNCGCGTDL